MTELDNLIAERESARTKEKELTAKIQKARAKAKDAKLIQKQLNEKSKVKELLEENQRLRDMYAILANKGLDIDFKRIADDLEISEKYARKKLIGFETRQQMRRESDLLDDYIHVYENLDNPSAFITSLRDKSVFHMPLQQNERWWVEIVGIKTVGQIMDDIIYSDDRRKYKNWEQHIVGITEAFFRFLVAMSKEPHPAAVLKTPEQLGEMALVSE